ncbi:RagB/SusD family nutrient uptake outer membrane protein [Pedobacter kyonggii]|uniref:RagB/SusD family nutrient uptake outer membrane protein n=1 Tax=Pedobacter kyonggii TaxID=1926871 RepID=A0A4Q9HDA6_9SPHI|nr:RagB/SusD family nutrient uptake outer membrane protein [Pedobacter kyonggii]TBO42482.1 RagB/SusD family nutrient uptake outer membrane protein [Pedobacter kyonggii]
MKIYHNHIIKIAIVASVILTAPACRKTYFPSDKAEDSGLLTTIDGMRTATLGNYATLKSLNYENNYHWLAELPSDEVAQGQNSSSDVTNLYKYTHLVNSANATTYFQQAYYVASATNKIIKLIPDGSSADLLQVKGENLFLRAMLHFNLVRMFGRPYAQNPTTNPGVPILSETVSETDAAIIKRSTVAQVYDFVIADLLKAAQCITVEKSNSFATKLAAYALLSRVYLYMDNNAKAIEYANLVISSNKYQLMQDAAYQTYFRGDPEKNTENIFAIKHTKTENYDYSAIGSLYYSGDANGNALGQGESGWGEIYASVKYYNFLNKYPQDKRKSFISPLIVNGVQQLNTKLTPAAPIYYVNKNNLQEGVINLTSPVYLRLAEMYLNRAEANAKLNNTQLALDDVNVIRTRAGIPTYTLADVTPTHSILDIVLEERWLELAFEGQRAYDLFRNNRPVVRDYPGTHSTINGSVNQTINPTDARVIYFIPQTERDKNPNLSQNP